METLPIDTMDVEVFERLFLRLLTSLYKLRIRLNEAFRVTHKDPSVLWDTVRRITRRIEKLNILRSVMLRRKATLVDGTGAFMMMESLIFKSEESSREFGFIETEAMHRLRNCYFSFSLRPVLDKLYVLSP